MMGSAWLGFRARPLRIGPLPFFMLNDLQDHLTALVEPQLPNGVFLLHQVRNRWSEISFKLIDYDRCLSSRWSLWLGWADLRNGRLDRELRLLLVDTGRPEC